MADLSHRDLTEWSERKMLVCETHHSPHDTNLEFPIDHHADHAGCDMQGCNEPAMHLIVVYSPPEAKWPSTTAPSTQHRQTSLLLPMS